MRLDLLALVLEVVVVEVQRAVGDRVVDVEQGGVARLVLADEALHLGVVQDLDALDAVAGDEAVLQTITGSSTSGCSAMRTAWIMLS